jgi:hypothetical protein
VTETPTAVVRHARTDPYAVARRLLPRPVRRVLRRALLRLRPPSRRGVGSEAVWLLVFRLLTSERDAHGRLARRALLARGREGRRR